MVKLILIMVVKKLTKGPAEGTAVNSKTATGPGLSRLAVYISLSGWVILTVYLFTSIEREGFSFQIVKEFISTEQQGIRFRALMLFGPLITSVLGYFLNEKAKAEKTLLRVNRALKTISACNLVMVRAKEEAQLLGDICKTIVATGGYRLAWVGYTEQGGSSEKVRAVAHFASGYDNKEDIEIIRADNESGHAPTAKAMLTLKPAIEKDVRHALRSDSGAVWPLKHGHASSISLPLSDDGKPLGILNIYSDAPNAFDEEEVRLLTELADDLAYGIMALRTRENHRKAQEKLRESQRSLSTLISNLPGMAYRRRHDSECTMEFVSEGCYELTGYLPQEIVGNAEISYKRIVHPDHRDSIRQDVQLALRDRKPFKLLYRITDKLGREKWVWEQGQGVFSSKGELMAVEGLITDITERKRAEERIEHHLEQVKALRTIDMAISSSLDLRVTLDVLLEQLINRLSVNAAAVLLLDTNTMRLKYSAGKGFKTERIKNANLRLGEGYAGIAAKERKYIVIPDLSKSKYKTTFRKYDFSQSFLNQEEGFKAYYATSLIVKGRVKGVLEVFRCSTFEPDSEWLDFLEALAGQAAIAIDNASLFDDLQRSHEELILAYDTTIEGWSKALDYRDRETGNHSQRVTEMTLKIAAEMGMKENELTHIRRGALLHDIGKLGVPDRILFKVGGLTDEDWAVMKRHPEIAYELLSPIPYLRPALDIPYCHHEKWDGTGYPRGLKEEQIPLSARIFAVVDVWDALGSDRPYRSAWPQDRIERHIRSLSGTHFDPKVVDMFLKLKG
jgi:PAS domain S-box-containing protein